MTSALASLANATATFQVPGLGTVVDPLTGNVNAAGATVTVTLFLRASEVSSSPLPGIDVVDTVYDGYSVAPTALDEGIVIGTEGTLTFGSEAAVPCKVTALRLPYGNTGVLGATLSQVLGERIQLTARSQG